MTPNVTPRAALFVVGVALLGCAGSDEHSSVPPPESAETGSPPVSLPREASNPLANTAWQLVYFQSMDDLIGTVKPDDPSLYSMRLFSDGTVDMKLNCNSATGTWRSEPGADPTSGSFEFGPLAATRALCPPPSLDEQLTSQAEYIRSYLLKDGRLFLSLMADGGIFAWEPINFE